MEMGPRVFGYFYFMLLDFSLLLGFFSVAETMASRLCEFTLLPRQGLLGRPVEVVQPLPYLPLGQACLPNLTELI